VRPTDENQHGSTRPNLMSSGRRNASDDNILAMLERDARARGGRLSTGARVWYGAAGVLAVALVGTLAWLASENGASRPLPADAARSVPEATSRMVGAPPVPAVAAAPVSEPDGFAPPLQGAAIIDAPAPVGEAADVQLAKTTEAGPAGALQALPDQTSLAVAQASAPPPLVLLAAEEASPAPVAAAPAPAAPPARSKPVAAVARPALAQPKVAAAAGIRRPARPAAARPGKAQGASAQQSPSDAADNDVALISAIITHASSRAAGRAQEDAASNCGADNCHAKPAGRR
jgi:hypothetical protein